MYIYIYVCVCNTLYVYHQVLLLSLKPQNGEANHFTSSQGHAAHPMMPTWAARDPPALA